MKVIDVSRGDGNVRSLRSELRRLQRTVDITRRTGLAMLIADEGKATMLSPTMHNAAYAAMDQDIVYIRAGTKDLPGLVAQLRDLGDRFKGASVTVPYKMDIMAHLDGIDEIALRIGAVNTVVNLDGQFHGYNSDYTGAELALRESIAMRSVMSAIVVGAGGAARGIIYMLKANGFVDIAVYNRTAQTAHALAQEMGVISGGSLQRLYDAPTADLIINTTSVGSKVGEAPDKSPVPSQILPRFNVAFDIVLTPIETPFLMQATSAGLKVVYGYRMLLYQAVKQVELFTAQQAPVSVMDSALAEFLKV